MAPRLTTGESPVVGGRWGEIASATFPRPRGWPWGNRFLAGVQVTNAESDGS